jgi:hypothetical protein
MRSSRCPLGRLLGRNWFKWYTYLLQRYFSVSAEEAAYFSQSASAQPFGWRGAYAIRVACLRQVKKEESRWRGRSGGSS